MSKAFFNAKAPMWDESIAEKDTGKLQRLAGALEITPGSIVLDVGTGTGVFVPFLLAMIGNSGKLVCVDFAEEMLNRARAKNFKGTIEYLCADVTETQLGDAIFDNIICYSSFPHFHDKPKALREMRRMLKKGGVLSVCHSSSREAINGIHRQMPEVCDHLLPDTNEMRRLFAEAGFENIRIDDNAESYIAHARKPV
ncbi:MAG TPA: ubiquinone biosynthesis protein UbiE [Dehalococcoidia bacterium]|nr:ubiquinone biosynthesis protein UbiE [Dehalococcoidia bacterium]